MAKKADDNVELPGRGYNTDDVKAMKEETRRGRGRRWGLLALATIVLIPGLLFALWSFITLSMSYSTGDRAGYVQKFSKKGWICKTWEGELAMSTVPGSMPQIFTFSVRDDRVAQQIQEIMRTQDGRVSLTYEEKKGVPTSCFGETDYFVTEARPIGPPAGTAPAQTPAPTAPTATPATPAAPGTPATTPAPASPPRP